MSSSSKDSIAIIVGQLVRSNWLLILLLWIIASVPRLIATWSEPYTISALLQLGLIGRAIDLVILWVLLRRLAATSTPPQRGLGRLAGFLLIGHLVWILSGVPVNPLPLESLWKALAIAQHERGLLAPSLALLSLVGSYCFSLWFFAFLTEPFRVRALWEKVAQAPALPLKILASAAGLPLFLAVLAEAWFPDGRSLALALLSTAFRTLPAVTIPLVSAAYLNISEFDKKPAPQLSFLGRPFAIAVGVQLLVLALLTEFANLARFGSLTPAAKLTVEAAAPQAEWLAMDVTLADPDYHLRGFKLLFLRIAESAKDPGTSPIFFEIDNAKFPPFAPLPRSESVSLRLFFPPHVTTRDKDLYYLTHKLSSLPQEAQNITSGELPAPQ